MAYHDEHSCTCHKAPNGERSCRMGFNQCPNNYGTRCIQIDAKVSTQVKNEKSFPVIEVEEID